MKEIETGKDKIKKICDAIKLQTIEPAKQKADEIIENAKLEAKIIIENAEKEKTQLLSETDIEIQKKEKLCLSAIKSASRQVIDQLKQDFENQFFTKNLQDIVEKATISPDIISNLIVSMIEAIEKEGVDVDLSALIPKMADTQAINMLLTKDIISKLKEKKVIEGNFSGGAKIKLHDKKITIDMSDEALKEIIARYIRKDFRDMIFKV